MQKKPVPIAIVGRPNVGKSTLFNRLLGRRKALVHPVPGTTRDRNEALLSWKGKKFTLIDTGGWAEDTSVFPAEVKKQMRIALSGAGIVLFMVDAKSGLHPLDAEISDLLRKQQKKVVLVVNKVDSEKDEPAAADFYRLGIDDLVPISADHGRNIFGLMDRMYELLPAPPREEEAAGNPPIGIIIVGKPNVGKSSLLNALCREPRCIVHHTPGTTREAIDITIQRGDRQFVLIDTPGLHRKRKFKDDLGYLAALSTHHAMERADVAILVMDPEQEIGETEAKIAEMILENRLACLCAVNKWDIVENREEAVKAFRQHLLTKLTFLRWSKLLFVSAKTGQRVENLLEEVRTVYAEYSRRVPEDELRETVRAAEGRKPLSRRGSVLRIRNVVQSDIRPPAFTFTVNDPLLVHFSYRRYLENALRERFGFTGTPVLLRFVRQNRGGEK